MSVSILLESCVRTLSVKSECQRCAQICGVAAVGFVDSLVKINSFACTDCGMCVSVCPTGAIVFDSKRAECLAVTELFCAAMESERDSLFEVEVSFLDVCAGRALEANRLLGLFGQKKTLSFIASKEGDDAKELDKSRRALFRMFTKEGVEASGQMLKDREETGSSIDYHLLKSKKIPHGRENFLSKVQPLSVADEVSFELSFASDKYIDDSCDNCSLCYNLCPSGALETTDMKNAILFSPHLCLRCKLCEDVCESGSISSLPEFRLKDFVEKPKKVLKKFSAKLCESCGTVFSSEGKECPRCAKESEDAMELLGL